MLWCYHEIILISQLFIIYNDIATQIPVRTSPEEGVFFNIATLTFLKNNPIELFFWKSIFIDVYASVWIRINSVCIIKLKMK